MLSIYFRQIEKLGRRAMEAVYDHVQQRMVQFNHYEGIEEPMEGGSCGIDEAF
jgi:hypothetical protein